MKDVLDILREPTRTRRPYSNQRYNDHDGLEHVQLQSIGYFDPDAHESGVYRHFAYYKQKFYNRYWMGKMNEQTARDLKRSIGRMLEIEFDTAWQSLERKK